MDTQWLKEWICSVDIPGFCFVIPLCKSWTQSLATPKEKNSADAIAAISDHHLVGTQHINQLDSTSNNWQQHRSIQSLSQSPIRPTPKAFEVFSFFFFALEGVENRRRVQMKNRQLPSPYLPPAQPPSRCSLDANGFLSKGGVLVDQKPPVTLAKIKGLQRVPHNIVTIQQITIWRPHINSKMCTASALEMQMPA